MEVESVGHRARSWVVRIATLSALVVGAQALAAPVAQGREAVVRSFDGTPLGVSFYPATGLAPGQRAPTILRTHGLGGSRDRASAQPAQGPIDGYLREGYNVLTWDSRGFGESGGTAMLNDPAFEGRDVRALLDFAAAQPEALLDAPGDPRTGMVGASYAGDIQLVAAALDRRIDAIVPAHTWNSLLGALYRDGALKSGWYDQLVARAAATGGLLGLLSPAGLQLGGVDWRFADFWLQATLGTGVSPRNRAFLAARDRASLLAAIRAPTLLIGGTPDALFSPSQAIANYAGLRAAGVPLKMLWECGGHATCATGNDPARVAAAELAWLARYVKRQPSVDTGPGFEWVADDGVWRSAPAWPPPPNTTPAGSLTATGSGGLTIVPGTGLGLPPTVRVPIPAPAAPADVAGEPQLRMTYSGTAVTGNSTWVYAQIVDVPRNLVVGSQVTPIPVTLDGQTRTVTRPLEGIAAHLVPGSKLELQIVSGTGIYTPQRALGQIAMSAIELRLP